MLMSPTLYDLLCWTFKEKLLQHKFFHLKLYCFQTHNVLNKDYRLTIWQIKIFIWLLFFIVHRILTKLAGLVYQTQYNYIYIFMRLLLPFGSHSAPRKELFESELFVTHILKACCILFSPPGGLAVYILTLQGPSEKGGMEIIKQILSLHKVDLIWRYTYFSRKIHIFP